MTNRKSDCRKNSESNRIQSRRKLKKAVSKAAAREGQAYPLGYVEALNDTRTLLADYFQLPAKENPVLLSRSCELSRAFVIVAAPL
jgi:hypothetical protein